MITPIEMYSMAPKSQEASFVQHGENVRHVAQQQGGMQSIEQQARQNTQQTVHAANADNPEYRYDAREQGNNSYNPNPKKKKKKDENDKNDSDEKKTISHGFDIRI